MISLVPWLALAGCPAARLQTDGARHADSDADSAADSDATADSGGACEEADLGVSPVPASVHSAPLAACTTSLAWSCFYPPVGDPSVLTVARGCLGDDSSTDLVMSRLPDLTPELIVPVAAPDFEYLNCCGPLTLFEVPDFSYAAIPVLYWTSNTEYNDDHGFAAVDPESGEVLSWLDLSIGHDAPSDASVNGFFLVGSSDRDRNLSQIEVYADLADDGFRTPVARSTSTWDEGIGGSIDPIGDIDGDGASDIVVFYVNHRPAIVFAPDIPVDEGVYNGVPLAQHATGAVVPIGDADGDGYGDIAAKSVTEGVGSPNGIAIIDGAANEVAAQIYDDRVGTWVLGESIHTPGDLDGNGVGELVASSWAGSSDPYLTETWVFSIPRCGSFRLTDIASQIERPAIGGLLDAADRTLLWAISPEDGSADELSLMEW